MAEDTSFMAFLNEHKTRSIEISVPLRRIETLLLQALLCAAKAWDARGLSFVVADISAQVDQDLTEIGVMPKMLNRRIGN